MKNYHVTLKREVLDLSELDSAQKKAASKLLELFEGNPHWNVFCDLYPRLVNGVLDERGMQRREIVETVLWKLAQDLGSRLGVDQGYVRISDYRDQLAALIRDGYKTQRAFCKATGLAEDLVSHVLAGRKHFALDTLMEALGKIGYQLEIKKIQENVGPAAKATQRRKSQGAAQTTRLRPSTVRSKAV